MRFTKKDNDPISKPIGALYPGDLFFHPGENDIYMFISTPGRFEGVNLATGEVERFDELMSVVLVEGELVWEYRAE